MHSYPQMVILATPMHRDSLIHRLVMRLGGVPDIKDLGSFSMRQFKVQNQSKSKTLES